jgi:hypothetical protein
MTRRRSKPRTLESPWAFDSILAGTALVRSGATEQGKRLLLQSLRTYSGRRRNATVFELGWWDVYAHSVLGDLDQACAALQQGVAEGYFLNLPALETHPFLAKLRERPCYQQQMALARTKAAAQVEAARNAGLL